MTSEEIRGKIRRKINERNKKLTEKYYYYPTYNDLLDAQAEYLVGLLNSKGTLLSPETRENAREALDQIYAEQTRKSERDPYTKSIYITKRAGLASISNYHTVPDYLKALKLYKEAYKIIDSSGQSGGGIGKYKEDLKREIWLVEDLFIKERSKRRKHSLEHLTSVFVIVGILGGLFLLSSNMTGNVIGNLNKTFSNLFGAILFAIGLFGIFSYLKNKRK